MKTKVFFLLLIGFSLFSCSKEEEVVTPPPTPTYTLSFSAEEGGSVSSEGGTYTQGSKITVTATPDAQYLFQEWSDGSTTNPREITVGSDLTLTASFVKKTYPLSVTVEGEGTVQEEVIIQGSTSETKYNAGTIVRLTSTPNEGWVFVGWSGDIESEELEIEVPIEKGTAVSALFKRDSFELFITIEGEGTVKEEVIVQPGQYDYETVVRLTAVPADGWEFSGWSGDVTSEENPIELEMASEINISAGFERFFDPLMWRKPSNETVQLMWDENWSDNDGVFVAKRINYPWQSVVVDYNYDGYLDFISYEIDWANDQEMPSGYTGYDRKKPVQFYLGSENGIEDNTDPLNHEKYLGRVHGSGIFPGDFNNDGLVDLLFAGSGYDAPPTLGEYVSIFYNDGKGSFIVKDLVDYVGYFHDVATGDIDNNGYLDIVLLEAGSMERDPYILWNNGSDFTGEVLEIDRMVGPKPEDFKKTWNTPNQRVGLFDVDRDGFLDIFIGNYEDDWRLTEPAKSYVLLGNGGNFGGAERLSVPLFSDNNYSNTSRPLHIILPDSDDSVIVVNRFVSYGDGRRALQLVKYSNGELVDVTDNLMEDPLSNGKHIFDLDFKDYDNDGVFELYNSERFLQHKYNVSTQEEYVEWEYLNGKFVRVE